MTALPVPAGYKHCRALGCSHNAKTNTRFSFFRFPKDEHRCEVWLKNCGLESTNFTAESCYNNMRLCSAHFEDDMFASLHKNRLKKTAVPTLFTHDKPVEKVIFVETPTKKIKKKSSKKNMLKKYSYAKKVTPKKSASSPKNTPNPLTCNLSEQVSLVVTPDVYSMTLSNYDDDSDEEMFNGNGNMSECNYRPMYDGDIEIEDDKFPDKVCKVEYDDDVEIEEEKYSAKIPKVERNDTELNRFSHKAMKMNYNDEIEIEGKYTRKIPKFGANTSNYNVHSNNTQNYLQELPNRVLNISSYRMYNHNENGFNKIPKMEVNTSRFQNMYSNDNEADGHHRFFMPGSSTSQNYHLTNALLNRVNGEQYNSEVKPRVTIDDFMEFCDSYFNKKLAAFIKSQIQLQELQGNLHKGVHYDETFKELALSIYTLDPKVYKLLSKTFHLPSKSTLMRTKNC